jgi:hypothetical protein
MTTYNKTGKQVVQVQGGTFWVFDRADLHKILTTPGPGTIVGPAIVGGATLGLVNVDPVMQAHQAVALKYLSSTGRTCDLKTSFEIWRPEYEHTYACRQ